MATEPDFFTIDKNQLDREWVNQPRLYHKYALQLADAKRDLEQAKTAAELAAAGADASIRKRPAKYGIDKITEPAVKAKAATHPKFIEATKALQTAQHRCNVLQAAVNTLDHRKRALENLVDLRLADYFSEPRAGRAARADIDDRATRRARRPMDNPSDD